MRVCPVEIDGALGRLLHPVEQRQFLVVGQARCPTSTSSVDRMRGCYQGGPAPLARPRLPIRRGLLHFPSGSARERPGDRYSPAMRRLRPDAGMTWRWLLVLAAACTAHARPPDAFRALVDREWAWRLQEFPLLASEAGVREADDRLGHVDAATQLRHLERWREIERFIAAERAAQPS